MKRFIEKRSLLVLLCLALLCSLMTGCQSRAASRTQKLIEQLDVSAPDGEAVARAREAYDALSPEERDTLENTEKLLEAETRFYANEVDAAIKALGEVTLESGPAIEAARNAYDALSRDSKALVTGLPTLTQAEEKFHQLTVAAAAGEIDAMIESIGEVTLDSREAIEAARAAYDSADGEVVDAVKSLDVLETAEKALHRLEVKQAAAEFDASVDALGEITTESRKAVEAVREAYDALDEEVRAEVTTLKTLEKAEETLVYLDNKAKAEKLDAEIAALGEVTEESESAVKALRKQYDALPADIRELVTSAETLFKAERTIQGIKDTAAAAEIKQFIDAKQYDEAIGYAEKYMKGRELSEIQGGVVKLCLNAYAAKANALIKDSRYEEAYNLLTQCKKDYAGADLSAIKKALSSLDKAIAEPANGKVFSSSARGGYCTLTVKAGDSPALIKVVNVNDSKSVVSFYVRANKSVTVHVKNGTYNIKYATGSKWFGSKNLFGSNTRYRSFDDTFKFSTSQSGRYINYTVWTVTLYSVAGGTGSTSSIPGEDF